jgi:RNA polymerase sigma factor (sigma-70 family)
VLYLIKSGAGEPEAQDAAQEAMTQLYTSWDKVGSHRAWVRRAAFSCYLRQKRKVHKETQVSDLTTCETPPAAVANDSCWEEQLRVVCVFRHLPQGQRQVAALFYDGLSLTEISEVVGKPISTVRSLLRHDRKRLKETVNTEGVVSPGNTR